MAHINLLPWREELRHKKQQEYYALLGITVLLGALLVFAGHLLINNQIAGQTAKNNYLKQEIKEVDKRLKEIKELDKTRQALLDRMEVIQELQASRPNIVHLFDEVVTSLPDGVYLTSLSLNGQTLAIQGKAESNARVSSHMRNIDSSEWMKNSRLSVIQTDAKNDARIRSFSLTATHGPNKPESETEGKQ